MPAVPGIETNVDAPGVLPRLQSWAGRGEAPRVGGRGRRSRRLRARLRGRGGTPDPRSGSRHWAPAPGTRLFSAARWAPAPVVRGRSPACVDLLSCSESCRRSCLDSDCAQWRVRPSAGRGSSQTVAFSLSATSLRHSVCRRPGSDADTGAGTLRQSHHLLVPGFAQNPHARRLLIGVATSCRCSKGRLLRPRGRGTRSYTVLPTLLG